MIDLHPNIRQFYMESYGLIKRYDTNNHVSWHILNNNRVLAGGHILNNFTLRYCYFPDGLNGKIEMKSEKEMLQLIKLLAFI